MKMKKLMVCGALCAMFLPACGQRAVGEWSVVPRVGAAFSSVSGDAIIYNADGAESESRVKVGVVAGADVAYQATDVIGFSLGAYYQRLGCRYADTDLSTAGEGSHTALENVRQHTDYLSLPVMVHVSVSRQLVPGLSVGVGVQPQVKLNARYGYQENEVTIGRDGSYSYQMGEDQSAKSTLAKSFDLAIPVAISYERQRVVLDLRYQLGLLKAYKYGLDGKNWAVVLSAGYRI